MSICIINRHQLVHALALMSSGLISGIILLKVNKYAFVYVGLIWLIFISMYIWLTKGEKRKLVAIYAGSIVLAFFLAELYFLIKQSDFLAKKGDLKKARVVERTILYGEHYQEHELLGYAPVPNSKWSLKMAKKDSIFYKVTQTIDERGWRITPGEVDKEALPVLFLGCSFTFGDGLNDDETLPYYLQQSSSGQLKSVNMGFSGYGAHQSLAILEEGLERDMMKTQMPLAGIYSAITDHVFRGTGRVGKSAGPAYVFNEHNELIKTTAKRGSSIMKRWLFAFRKSYFLRRLLFRRVPSKESDINLTAAMIARSVALFEDRYHNPFYCLLWDESYAQEGLYEKLRAALQTKGVKTIEVKKIIPDYREEPKRYRLDQYGHPTPLANQLIAAYLYEFLKKENEVDPQN